MATKALTDRLSYYPTRQRWRVRYRNEDGVFRSKLFGPRCRPEDQAAYATAVLEADLWLSSLEKKFDVAAHAAALKAAEDKEREHLRMVEKAGAGLRAGELSRDEALDEFGRAVELSNEATAERDRLQQPQLRLLRKIDQLRPLADRAVELDQENERLKEENDHLRALLAASGRAAATEVGDLAQLVEKFIESHWGKLKAKNTSAKTMTPIRSSSRKVVEFLAGYTPTIETSADLDACPRALGDYRDMIVEGLGDKSSGWARKQLDGPRHFCEWLNARGYLAAVPRSIGRDWMQVGADEPDPKSFNDDEIRTLVSKAPDNELRLAVLLGVNAGYRESDIVSLRAADVDLANRIIKRRRNKTNALQVHRLFNSTALLLGEYMDAKHDGRPLASMKRVSVRLTAFIDETIEGNAEAGEKRRTAKHLRSTAAQLVEQLTGGDNQYLVSQMLGHTDKSIAQHYRRQNFESLFKVIDRMEQRLGL